MTEFSNGATIILVHGAWADGSSFSELVVPLETAGLRVVAAPIPLTSLSNDVRAVERVIARTDGPILLAAHAYAGGVIGAIGHGRVTGYAYIAALAPDEGETVGEVFYRNPPHPDAPALAPDGDGLIWLPDEAFGKAFAHNAPSERTAQLASAQRPISVDAISEKSPPPGWKIKPSFYLTARHDRMIPEATQQFMAERMGAEISRLDADHTPMVTAPAAVIHFLLAAAGKVLSGGRA